MPEAFILGGGDPYEIAAAHAYDIAGSYEAMIKIATHEMDRSDLAEYFRSMLSGETDFAT